MAIKSGFLFAVLFSVSLGLQAAGVGTTLSGEPSPPVITDGPTASVIGGQVRIGWTTNELADSRVRFATQQDALVQVAGDIEFTQVHDVWLGGLEPNTLYYYEVQSHNPMGLGTASAVSSFTSPVAQTLSLQLSGDGTVQGLNLDCDSNCTVDYADGTVLILSADAPEGYEFAGWSGDCSGSDPTCELTVTGTMNVSATFTSSSNGGGEDPDPGVCGPDIDHTLTVGPAHGATQEVVGCRSIFVEHGVHVSDTSALHLVAYERIVLQPGVSVAAGGRLTARVNGSAGTLGGTQSVALTEPSMVPMQSSVDTESGSDLGSGSSADGGDLTETETETTTGFGAWASWDESSDAEWQEAGLAAPQGLTAIPGDQSVILRWDAVPEADGYHIFWSRTPGIHPFTAASYDGFRVNRCNGPVAVSELENDTEYFFVVTANRGSEESGASAEVAATPEAGPMVVAGRYRLEAFDAPTVVDLDTGLEWQRCALGQTWEGNTCVGEASRVTWAEAAFALEALNEPQGDRPWQLPALAQLQGLVFCSSGIPADFPDDPETGCWGSHGIPTLEPTVFPATTVTSGWFWSATPEAEGRAWGVDFDRGIAHAYQESAFSGVRLVRPASKLPK